MERSCKPMTYTRAIWLLGLDLDFDEKQVKSKYRFLAKKYHPDLYDNTIEEVKLEAQDKFKHIVVAYEFLEKHYRFYSCEEDFSIEEFKEALLDSFFDYVKISKDCSSEEQELIDKVREVCNLFDTSLSYFCGSKEKLEQLYKKYVANIEKIYRQFSAQFINKHGINQQCVSDNIYYDVSTKTFYAQMLECQRKQEEFKLAIKDKEFRKKLMDATYDYQYYAFYQEYNLGRFIEMIRNQAAEYAYSHKYVMKEDYILKSLHKGVNKVFALASEIDRKFNELKDIQDPKLAIKIKGLRNLVNTCPSLEEIDEKLDSILENVFGKKEEKILEEQKVEAPKENKIEPEDDVAKTRIQMADKTYNLLVGRFNNFLSQNNNIQNIDAVNKAFLIAQSVITLIQQFINSELDIDKLLMLSEISFEDFTNDNLILEKIQNPTNDFRRS